jgi:hypothetical protein
MDTDQFVPNPIRPNFGQFVSVPIYPNFFQNGYIFSSLKIVKKCDLLITLGVETESQYCSFTTFCFLFRGCYLHILLRTLIVIGVNSCSTDPNNNKIEK